MKVPSYTHRDEPRETMSMTPMIDVVFLLLIFFVCASVGQTRELLLSTPLAAGGVQTENSPEEMPLHRPDRVYLKLKQRDGGVLIDLDGRILESHEETRAMLIEVARIAPEIPVVIETADDVPLGEMIRLYDTCRSVDFETINFAISNPARRVAKPRN
jgi:biopolymer transport protein ExbD